MRKRKLKKWVVPSIYLFTLAVMAVSLVVIGKIYKYSHAPKETEQLVSKSILEPDEVTEVAEITNETINKPYLAEGVSLQKDYYDSKKSEEEQLKSLLYYKNTYMENTGHLYTSDKTFDVVSVLDGTVTSITDDEILGKVVEVTHSTELVSVYECLGNVSVNVGDAIKQNDVIGQSGTLSVDKGYDNALLFEVNYQGAIINPTEFYAMKVSDILK